MTTVGPVRGLCAGLLVLVLGLGSVRAEPLVLTPENLVKLTVVMLQQGKPEQALRFSSALVQRNPGDATALILKSRAERDLGFYAKSVATGRQAWTHADLPRERFGASMAVAQGMASNGQKFRAQFWLRRAAEEAPNESARAMAMRDFDYVRSRSRLSVQLDFSARPSSNVNGGSSEKVINFMGIPLTLSPDALALSGGKMQAAVTARYRLAESDRAKTDLRFGLVERRVWLSDASKLAAPMADSGDYAFSGYELGFDQAWKVARLGGEVTGSLSLGYNRYGGSSMSNYTRLDLGANKGFGGRISGQIGLSLERTNRLDDPKRSATVAGLSLAASKGLATGDRLSLSIGLRHSQSKADSIDHKALSAEVGWRKAAPVLNTKVSASLGVEARDYPVSPYTSGGRQDLSVNASISLSFDKLDYMGFAPVMTIEAEKTRSNVAINTSQSLGVGFSVKSSF